MIQRSAIPFDAIALAHRIHQATSAWHREPAELEHREPAELGNDEPALQDSLLNDPHRIAMEMHRANFDLWHHEDLARDPAASHAEIVQTKRAIDKLNQQRNNSVEELDLFLFQTVQNAAAPLHSETPGMMLDRVSILSLKRFHTGEEAVRTSASTEHRSRNRQRLTLLEEQAADLTAALAEVWQQVLVGTRRFKLYRQFKMYNDPSLNPILYKAGLPPKA